MGWNPTGLTVIAFLKTADSTASLFLIKSMLGNTLYIQTAIQVFLKITLLFLIHTFHNWIFQPHWLYISQLFLLQATISSKACLYLFYSPHPARTLFRSDAPHLYAIYALLQHTDLVIQSIAHVFSHKNYASHSLISHLLLPGHWTHA